MEEAGNKVNHHRKKGDRSPGVMRCDLAAFEASADGHNKYFSRPQSITQKGVHAHPLTAREREHWFLQHLSHFLTANFGRQ